MASQKMQQGLVLGMSTAAFTICFMVWMMFAVLGVPIKELLQLNETQFGLLASTPVLTGSLIRLPLGMLTDKYGGRIVFFALMLCTVLPIWLIGKGTEYWHFLLAGLFVVTAVLGQLISNMATAFIVVPVGLAAAAYAAARATAVVEARVRRDGFTVGLR